MGIFWTSENYPCGSSLMSGEAGKQRRYEERLNEICMDKIFSKDDARVTTTQVSSASQTGSPGTHSVTSCMTCAIIIVLIAVVKLETVVGAVLRFQPE